MSNYYVCCIARLEGRYIREFVEHYLSLGFTKVIICDNNHDGEDDLDVINDYVEQGKVIIEDYRNQVKAQMRAYTDMYAKYGKLCSWILFCDVDEFLVLTKHKSIEEFLKPINYYECVFINWMCMTDNNLIRYEDKPLMERFTEPCPRDIKVQYAFEENKHVKSIIKGGLDGICFYGNPHVPSNNLLCCNAEGRRCDQSPWQPISWETAYFKHFTTKTLEEWFDNKLRKGTGDRTYELFLKTYQDRFFKYNKPTKEKDAYIRMRAQKEKTIP